MHFNRPILFSREPEIIVKEVFGPQDKINLARDEIERIWSEKGRGLFNGKLCHFIGVMDREESVLEVGILNYKAYFAQKNGLSLGIFPLGVSSILFNEKKEVLFGIRGNVTSGKGLIELVASGSLSVDDNLIEPSKQMKEELWEEANIPSEQLHDFSLKGIVFDDEDGVYDLVYSTNVSSAEIEIQSNGEYQELFWVAPKNLAAFLKGRQVVKTSLSILSIFDMEIQSD